jgi:hypothetical protein
MSPPTIPGPGIIGATGGSGTRAVARIVRRAGMFIGANLNVSEDALDFGDYSDRWINVFVAGQTAGLSPATQAEMARDLQATLARHLVALAPPARAWGWKEPRSIFLLPFFHSQFPTLKFLHVIRDGRDMAYSANQNQLRKHGDALLGPPPTGASQPLRSIALWSRVNMSVADYGEGTLHTRYLRVRFEDLCRQPEPTVARILAFFELGGDAAQIAGLELRPPDSVGRWRGQDRDTVAQVQHVGRPALDRFGYRDTLE